MAVNIDVYYVSTLAVVSWDKLAPVLNMGHQLQHCQHYYLTTIVPAANMAPILIINAIRNSGSLNSARWPWTETPGIPVHTWGIGNPEPGVWQVDFDSG